MLSCCPACPSCTTLPCPPPFPERVQLCLPIPADIGEPIDLDDPVACRIALITLCGGQPGEHWDFTMRDLLEMGKAKSHMANLTQTLKRSADMGFEVLFHPCHGGNTSFIFTQVPARPGVTLLGPGEYIEARVRLLFWDTSCLCYCRACTVADGVAVCVEAVCRCNCVCRACSAVLQACTAGCVLLL